MGGWGPRLAVVLALSVAACGGEGSADLASVPAARVTSTTGVTATTLSPEAEVEAAYLRSWEVYAKAVLELDASGLEEAYAGLQLERTRRDVQSLIEANTPVRVDVEHDYRIQLLDNSRALVTDRYINHSVLLDRSTMEPVEADPNSRVHEVYTLEAQGEQWKVIDIVRERFS